MTILIGCDGSADAQGPIARAGLLLPGSNATGLGVREIGWECSATTFPDR
jgi:hypothetical protein